MIAGRVIGRSIMPGQTAHTWIPCGPSSAFSDSLIPTTPNFDAEYGAICGAATSPAIDAVLTIEERPPCFKRRGTNACTTNAIPRRFTPIPRCQSSTVVCSMFAAWPMPAFECSTSTRDSSSYTRAQKASTASGSVTSTVCDTPRPPRATSSPTTASADSPLMSATCTLAPRRENSIALERPMPDPAPVTTTILPSKAEPASMPAYATARGLHPARQDRTAGLAHLPRDDELRQLGVAAVGARRARCRAVRPSRGRGRHHVFRHGRHVLARRLRGGDRAAARQVHLARRRRGRHQGLQPDGAGREPARARAKARGGVDRRVAAAARHGLCRPLPDAPLGSRHADRGDDGGPERRRAGREGALHRGVEHVRVAVREGAARGSDERLGALRVDAAALQPALSRGGAGDDPAVPRPGGGRDPMEPAGT